MEKPQQPLARGISYLLIYLTAIHQLHPAFAAGVTPANSSTQVQAGNVPVINIAPPNSAGISHNQYQDFNVGTAGAVLNNATAAGTSQLAGQLNANGNLQGKAAELIINEVTGGNRSQLAGKLEVFGRPATVMIANPNGISCDGCGFINTPGITLTTGTPQFDPQGTLAALEVKTGAISIGGNGLDANTQDYVDIISRATELNGKINAQNLALIQGVNRVSYTDGTITALNAASAKPQLAVDTKALGGMYANKIRLVATEEGVGVKLANLTSTQQGISLSANGKIQLGNTHAKSDLNISAQHTDIADGVTVKSAGDITVASTDLSNRGSLIAGQDMRLFNDNLTNVQGTIEANNHLWIQKDALGNKSTKVENRSGKINTNNGDMVIRTQRLENTRDQFEVAIKPIIPTESAKKGMDKNTFPNLSDKEKNKMYFGMFNHFKDGYPETWFGEIDMLNFLMNPSSGLSINTKKTAFSLASIHPAANISSQKSIYINADIINNTASKILASQDIILTGKDLNNKSFTAGNLNEFQNYKITGIKQFEINCGPCTANIVSLINNTQSWKTTDSYLAELTAGGNLVADFTNTIHLDATHPTEARADEAIITSPPNNISAKNILLHAGIINSSDALHATENITLIAENSIHLTDGKVLSGNNISIIAAKNIDTEQSHLSGKDITLQSREGSINARSNKNTQYYSPEGVRQFSQLRASGTLLLHAGKDLNLENTHVANNKNTSLLAGNNLRIENDESILHLEPLEGIATDTERQLHVDNTLKQLGHIQSANDITLNAGNTLTITGATFNADKDISVTAGTSINVNPLMLTHVPETLFAPSRQPELSTTLSAGNQLLLSSGGDLLLQSANLSAQGHATLLAGNNLHLLSTAYSTIDSKNDNNKDDRHVVTQITAGKNLMLAANGEWVANGAALTSGNDMSLSAGGNMQFNAVANHLYREGHREFSESITQQSASLNSGGALSLLSNGSILFQAAQLVAKNTLDAAAKGGFLYAQAMEDASHYEKTTTKRKWWGQKTTIHQTHHEVSNKVTAFTAGGDINLMSRDDSTFEASKINAGNNATLTSTQGKVNFKAVKDSAFDQTQTNSKGFFIKIADKGSNKETWVLPTVYTGGTFTVDAAAGINADVKAQNAAALQNALLTLGNTPGTTWLNDLSTRKDVQWNQVQDAYSSWNHKSQSLNPVVAAVIAIAVAAVTAGAGLAAAGELAAGAAGGVGTTMGAAAYGAAFNGMTALTSQAAVSLINNQGNISKTLQALGNSHSVKSLATAMVVGGALSGFDKVMAFDKPPTGTSTVNPGNAKLPMLSNGDWSKIAQRVAGQSVISSSLNTAINGGSFQDNFTAALLANVGSQLQAQGAQLIGDNGDILGVPGKAVSHAVVAGIAAEIGGGNGKGAAAGALAAELAGVIMQSSLFEPTYLNEKERQLNRIQEALTGSEAKTQAAKIVAAITGAITTHIPEGVTSGASAGEQVYRYNFNEHLLDSVLTEANNDIDLAKKGDPAAIARVQARNDALASAAVIGGGGLAVAAGGVWLVGAAPELVMAARLVLAGCKSNPALCLNQAGIFAADLIAPEAAIGMGAALSGTTYVLGKTEQDAKQLSQQLSKTTDSFYNKQGFNTQPVAEFVKGETSAGGKLSNQTADYLRDLQKANTEQVIKVFDKTQPDSKLVVFGREIEQVLGDGGSNKTGTTKVFASQKLTDADIRNYAQSLAGGAPLQEVSTAPGRYYAVLSDGSTINLRNVSTSANETNARWTIEIRNNEQFDRMQGKVKKKIELKFQ